MKWILAQNAVRLLKAKDIKTIYCENINDTYTIYCELYGEEEKQRYILAVYHNDWQADSAVKYIAYNHERAFEKCLCNKCDPPPVITVAETPEPIKRKGFFRKWGKRDE